MKRLFLVLFACLPATAGTGEPDDATKKEIAQLQGSWKVVSLTTGGEELSPKQLADLEMKVVFSGDRLKVHVSGGVSADVPFKVNPSKQPKVMEAALKGKGSPGIYFLSGDVLILCAAEGEAPTPTEFVSVKGKSALWILKREKR